MGTFVVTGSASGIGAVSAAMLSEAGHRVIGVDLHDAEIEVDLGTVPGREHAVRRALEICGGTLDGVASVAGVGPHLRSPARSCPSTTSAPSAFSTVCARPLASSGAGHAVAISSNSASTVPLIDEERVRELARTAQEALPAEIVEMAPSIIAYATSKLTLAQWVRATAVTPRWAREGVVLNAIAMRPDGYPTAMSMPVRV